MLMVGNGEVDRLPERVADLPQPIVLMVIEALRFMREKKHGHLEFHGSEGSFKVMFRERQVFPL